MNRTGKLLGIGAVCALAVVPLLMGAQSQGNSGQAQGKPEQAQGKGPPQKITGKTLIAVDELKWVALPGIEGAQQAMLWGDTAKEAHRAFFKYPVGLKSPEHTHSYGERGVIVSGTLSLAVEGAAPKHLPPGSFFSMAAGTKHITAVEGKDPCVFYMEREGPFDVVVPEAKGKQE